MTRIPLLISLLALATAATAAEPTAKVDATFGNTVMSVYPDGRSQKIWLQPDGTWTGLSRRGNSLAGKWSVKGDKVCLRQSKPPTLPISFCRTFPADPAKGIDSEDLTGTPIHIKLVKGHVEKSEG
ncbi:hypothetical protein [Phenylobacterium sp.]|jgi:hypothetical protein|uniref:hypothetical protein n=1 Tax=Phenylobacterium sp. TaxID=1871053 RepID=UPI002E348B00|nr:hypothetical protein [Phenylobacterium sp.]HEX3363992.1 hypothetical protein [Phenylobacterium sp.]